MSEKSDADRAEAAARRAEQAARDAEKAAEKVDRAVEEGSINGGGAPGAGPGEHRDAGRGEEGDKPGPLKP
jgi:hypothetical protein